MYSATDLLDMHTRTHAGTAKLLRHCRKLSQEELHRELDGFGYPTVQLQLHHIIDAEAYWIGVLQGRFAYEDSHALYPTVKSLEAYRKQVAAETESYLRGISAKALNTPAQFQVWQRRTRVLLPARVVLRPITHAFHHRGQVVAMCRLLGHPTPALDYPLLD